MLLLSTAAPVCSALSNGCNRHAAAAAAAWAVTLLHKWVCRAIWGGSSLYMPIRAMLPQCRAGRGARVLDHSTD